VEVDVPDNYDSQETGISWSESSATFRELYRHFFVSSRDYMFIPPERTEGLSGAEEEALKILLRKELHRRYVHHIGGVGALRDTESVEPLRAMLSQEKDKSRKLTIARALWHICREPVLYDWLVEMVRSNRNTLKQAHIDDVLVLQDERSIALLMDLLNDKDSFVRHLALSHLNAIEFKKSFLKRTAELPHDAAYYRARRNDKEFVAIMVENLRSPRDKWPVEY
jgi:hypothetical protein